MSATQEAAIPDSTPVPNSKGGTTWEIEYVPRPGMKNRLRIQVTQNTKGYQFERTAEVEGECSPEALAMEADAILKHGETVARLDISRCQMNDLKAAS